MRKITILYCVFLYMSVQYLLVPLLGLYFDKSYKNYYFESVFIALAGFVIGSLFIFFKFTRKQINVSDSIQSVNFNAILASSFVLFALGFIVKLKSAILDHGAHYISFTFFKPNLLHVSGVILFSLYLMLRARVDFKSKLFYYCIIFITLMIFNYWLVVSAVGRASMVLILLSMSIGCYMINTNLKIKSLIIVPFVAVIIMLSVGYIKALHFSQIESGSNISFDFIQSNLINRISHSHVLNAVVDSKPSELYIGLYGLTDSIRFPFAGIDRVFLSGQDFGHSVNLISEYDQVTGVAPTFIGDMFLRTKGPFFLFFGMLIVGLFYGVIDLLVNLLSPKYALPMSTLVFPYLVYGTEDFIFLSIGTAILMYSFYLMLFISVNSIINIKCHNVNKICGLKKLEALLFIGSFLYICVAIFQYSSVTPIKPDYLTRMLRPDLKELSYIELLPGNGQTINYKSVKNPELFLTELDVPLIESCFHKGSKFTLVISDLCLGLAYSTGLVRGKSLDDGLMYFEKAAASGNQWALGQSMILRKVLNKEYINNLEICDPAIKLNLDMALSILETRSCPIDMKRRCDSANIVYRSKLRYKNESIIHDAWVQCGLKDNLSILYSDRLSKFYRHESLSY